jgi:LacI family transcriptional regulator
MVTMADVARLAGVSVSTVSHVINETRPVSEELRRRVQDAILASGYHPNQIARALATSNSSLIGIVMSAMSNPMFGDVVAAMEAKARRHGYTLLVTDSRDDPVVEAQGVRVMLDRRVDGVILAPANDERSAGILELLATRRTPTVLLDRFADPRFDMVGAESVRSTALLVEHLARAGHQRIGFLSGMTGVSTTTERLEGYRLGLAEWDLPFERALVRSGRSTVSGGYHATRALLSGRRPPTAIIGANNNMTVGAYRAAREVQRQIPDDLAIVSFDDIEWADLFEPSLTAVAQPIAAMGSAAISLLLTRMEDPEGVRSSVRLPTTFVHRESCGCRGEGAGAALSA